MRRLLISMALLGISVAFTSRAQEANKAAVAPAAAEKPVSTVKAKQARTIRSETFTLAEGEKRFRQNCGRCHGAPDKFPPRMTATVLRHMRVRATITDEDARLVLWYMTQ